GRGQDRGDRVEDAGAGAEVAQRAAPPGAPVEARRPGDVREIDARRVAADGVAERGEYRQREKAEEGAQRAAQRPLAGLARARARPEAAEGREDRTRDQGQQRDEARGAYERALVRVGELHALEGEGGRVREDRDRDAQRDEEAEDAQPRARPVEPVARAITL